MVAGVLVWLGLGWWLASTGLHWLTAGLARRPRGSAEPPEQSRPAADFSIVAPMNGAADPTYGYVKALERLAEEGAEVLICVASEEDEAIVGTRSIWREAPILIGSDDTFNPKMNNVRKGLEAASRPVVALCDAGIQLDAAVLSRAAAPLSDKIGLVLALKAAEAPTNFAAEIECAYIDGHQARFLFAADRLGLAVASGGVTLLSHDTLQRIGVWRGFNRWIADDYSVTRSVRELGLATRLGDPMPRLPIGRRDWATVWRRQVRWARTRLRLPVWPLVLWEPLVGWLVSGVVGAAALVGAELELPIVAGAVAAHTLCWLAAEKWFMAGRGLAFGPRAMAAALVREALAPVLMIAALAGRTIDWRGTDLGGQWRDQGAHDQGGWVAPEPRITPVIEAKEITTVALPEHVDSTTCPEIEKSMREALLPGTRLLVDGSAVTYMSAAGVRTLADTWRRAQELEARVVFCHFAGAAADCLMVSGFGQLLEVASSLQEAEARLAPEGVDEPGERLHQSGAAG
jgi:ceramide glucosyltransferase